MIAPLERFLFRHRVGFLVVFGLVTVFMGWSASRLRVDAGFAKQLPLQHEYIQTYTEHQAQFGGANRIVIALMAREGDIFNAPFFALLERLTEEVSYIPGVDRSTVTSIFTPNVRFVEIAEDGFRGGNVIPADFEPTPEFLATVRENVIKSGRVGQLVANDFSGAVVSAQLLEIDPLTGERLDYLEVADFLEEIRRKITGEAAEVRIGIHIIGFAKVIGDVSEGARGVIGFFGISFLLTGLFVRLYSRSWRLTVLPLGCSAIAVVWQLGILPLLGFGIDPMSILVPFLVFAIGVSHGVQMIRCFRNEVFAGAGSLAAARSAFRQLVVPGGLALVTDTIGFLTLLLIDIGMIRELAITASLGVAVIIVTNLLLLPVLLSWVRLPEGLADRVLARRKRTDVWWRRLDGVTAPVPSLVIIAVAAGLFLWGFGRSREVHIGDLHSGVPELRQDSRYNEDTAVITSHFTIGVDLLSVIVETVPDGCIEHDVMETIARFEWEMANVEGVQSVVSIASVAKVVNAGWNEGSLKWRMLPRVPDALAQAVSPIETATGLLNADASVLPVHIFLTDHKAETLERVTDAVKAFEADHGGERARFRLATGNAGVMAATNEVVRAAQFPMLLWVFASVILLCLLTFRSWRATFCIVAPLALVSVLAYALMTFLEIGLKVSTLPVVALGVGIGVDYGIYLYSRLRESLDKGAYFEDALYTAFTLTGSAVVFTGITLAAGVSTWIFSDLKFQADMGVLLTFMFLLNMLGAILLMPAIARWLFRHHPRREVNLPSRFPGA
jgi:uncharacterized protein